MCCNFTNSLCCHPYFSKHAYPWGVAGEAAQVGAAKHLDPLRRRVDALVECRGETTKIFNVILPSSCKCNTLLAFRF